MKILVVCQHYWPEPFPLTDVCEGLVQRGHDVHVVTDVPNYPMGYIYPNYQKRKNRFQEHNGVRITRTFTVGRRNNVLFRMLNYFSYAISSTWYVLRSREDYDVVFTNQSSPVTMVSAALAYAKKWNKKTVLYCMDLWPASLAAGGIRESSPIYKMFHKISGFLYRRADRILITSQMFLEYFRREFDIPEERIGYLPQYAPADFELLPPKEQGETVDLVFAGNIGTAQCIPTILAAAKKLQDTENILWHIVGDGSELNNAKKMASDMGLDCVLFHGRKPLEQMPQYYAMADAMLVTLTANPFISMTLPGKVQTYMASGRPIIAAANGETSTVLHAAGCGFCAKAEDADDLSDKVRSFITHQDKARLGFNARNHYLSHFTREMFLNKLEQEFINISVNQH